MAMKTVKAYLQDLVCSSTPIDKNLILKVVIKKDATQFEGKPTFQSYTFMDEQGTRRRAGVFGRQISFLNKLLVLGEAYEITKPIYRDVVVLFSMYPREKQLILSGSTIIKHIKPSVDYPIFTPTYVPLSEIHTMLHGPTFDIAVSIVRVDQTHQVTSKNSGNPIDLAYLFLTDDSINDTIQMTSWKAYAHQCQTIPDWDTTRDIIVFNDVRAVLYEAKLTLSTTFGTQIDVIANGERPTVLKRWAESNRDMLVNRKLSIADIQPRKLQAETHTLNEALNMDPLTTQPDSNIRVFASVSSFGTNSPRTRISCPKCFTPFFGKANVNQICTSCTDPTLCTAKMFIDFTIEEAGNKTELSAMTKTAEKMLKIKAVDFHNMSNKERSSYSSDALEILRLKKIPLILTPNPTHLANGDMEWELKYIEGN